MSEEDLKKQAFEEYMLAVHGLSQGEERERPCAAMTYGEFDDHMREAFDMGYHCAQHPPKSDKSHDRLVMEHLERYGSITQEEARRYDVRRLSAVILDLKKSGVLISDTLEREGKRNVKRYFLEDVNLLSEQAVTRIEEKTIGVETFYKVHMTYQGHQVSSDWCSLQTKARIQAVQQLERLLAKEAQ